MSGYLSGNRNGVYSRVVSRCMQSSPVPYYKIWYITFTSCCAESYTTSTLCVDRWTDDRRKNCQCRKCLADRRRRRRRRSPFLFLLLFLRPNKAFLYAVEGYCVNVSGILLLMLLLLFERSYVCHVPACLAYFACICTVKGGRELYIGSRGT